MTELEPPIAFTVAVAGYEQLAKSVWPVKGGGLHIQGYGQEARFRFKERTARDSADLGAILTLLSRDKSAAVVRGAILPRVAAAPLEWHRRRSADVDPAQNTLAPQACAWIAVDMDDLAAPAGLDWLHDPGGAARHAITLLPPELADTCCTVQLTGSAGFTGPETMRLRLWFALAVAVGDLAARRWARGWNAQAGSRLIDPALFSPVQLHYTAVPTLAAGVADPAGRRWGFVKAARDRAVLAIPPDEPPWAPGASLAGGLPDGSQPQGFAAWLAEIGSVEHGFWHAINPALGAAVQAGLDQEATVAAIRAAVLAAPPGHRSRQAIARYADPTFLRREFMALHRRHAARGASAAARAARLFPGSSFGGSTHG